MINIGSNCIGCTKCVRTCPFGALTMVDRKAVVNSSCTLCGACIPECPVKCITLPSSGAVKQDISAYKGVWIFMEVLEGRVRSVGFELLSKGRELADSLGEELCAVLIGSSMQGSFAEVASYGADKIYSVDGVGYKEYNSDAYANAFVTLIKKYKPSVVLYPSTYAGRDLSPRVSAELFVGLTADCTALSVNEERNLVQSRPAFGGNIMADILTPNHRPQMATVRPNVMKKVVSRPGFAAAVINEPIALTPKSARVRIISKHMDPVGELEKIDEAEVIISGGRGMKDAQGFAMLDTLAQSLGGAVGSTRAAIDMGLIEKDRQIGQSGVTVRPKLYIACGISGAVQHIVGMDASDTIIAINKDPKAPIFNYCKFGMVGDAHQILPKVIEEIKKIA